MNKFDGCVFFNPNPPPVAICPDCDTQFVGSAHPPKWEKVQICKVDILLCPDCAAAAKAAAKKPAAKRTRTRKGGAV